MLDTITGFLSDYGLIVLFVSIFLEATGLPFPGESILIAAGIMAGHGELSIWGVFLSAFIAGTLGDNLGYYLGHRFGPRLVDRFGSRLGITPEKYRRVELSFRRWGPPIILVGRFVLILRQLCGFTAGTLRLPWWEFLLFNALGAALWAGVYGFGAYLFGNAIDYYLHGNPWAYALIAVIFLSLTGATLWRFRQELRRDETAKETEVPQRGSSD